MASDPNDLQSILTAAISDLAEHGFDTSERVLYWQRRIREAAEASLKSQFELDQMLREALQATWRKTVELGGALRYHRGVARFTIERLRPQLRQELDRRILASADLIKLNRQQAIDKTLQRFSGWATSIPAGGSKTVDKRDDKKAIKKALAGLPFEERRVIIDQGHKLNSSINNIIAMDGGAIAVEWHSHFRQRGYDFREDHKERDVSFIGPYLIKNSWAHKAGLVKPGEAGYYDNVTSFGEEVSCRCYGTYLYALRDLPEALLTKKGIAEMTRVKALVAAP